MWIGAQNNMVCYDYECFGSSEMRHYRHVSQQNLFWSLAFSWLFAQCDGLACDAGPAFL